MNTFRTTFAGVIAGLLFSVNAGAATIWAPTNENVNVLQVEAFGLSLNGGSLALFEDGEALTDANALVLGSGGGVFEFTDNLNGTFTVEAFVGAASQGTKAIDGNAFVLGVKWGVGAYTADSSAVLNATDLTTYVVGFSDGVDDGAALVVDVTAVPLPAAAWLFGSALMGLVAVKRRKQV